MSRADAVRMPPFGGPCSFNRDFHLSDFSSDPVPILNEAVSGTLLQTLAAPHKILDTYDANADGFRTSVLSGLKAALCDRHSKTDSIDWQLAIIPFLWPARPRTLEAGISASTPGLLLVAGLRISSFFKSFPPSSRVSWNCL